MPDLDGHDKSWRIYWRKRLREREGFAIGARSPSEIWAIGSGICVVEVFKYVHRFTQYNDGTLVLPTIAQRTSIVIERTSEIGSVLFIVTIYGTEYHDVMFPNVRNV